MFNQVFQGLKECAVWINKCGFQEGLKMFTDHILFGSPIMNIFGPTEYMRLPSIVSDHWSIKLSIVY